MLQQSNAAVQFDTDQSIYILRLVGTIDADTLNEATTLLARKLAATLVPNTVIKILLDVHETGWDSESTHLGVRHMLQKHLHAFQAYQHVLAVFTPSYDFYISPIEAFFTDEQAAVNWLQSKQ